MSREGESSRESTPPSPKSLDVRMQIEGFTQRFERMFERQNEAIRNIQETVANNARRQPRDHSSHSDRDSSSPPRERRRDRRRDGRDNRERRDDRRRDGRDNRERRDDRRRREEDGRVRENERIGGVKIKIPSFHGRNDVEAYLEWELKIEQVFSCHDYSEEKKVKVASLEFHDYALVWWDQVQKERRRFDEQPVATWVEMKNLMRKRFVPTYYHRELHTKLQGLRQGGKSVDDYYKEMEVAMIRANVSEEREATMARFLNGLNHDIRDIVELYPYVELEDLVHQAIKVEAQLKRKGTLKKSISSYNPKGWKEGVQKEGTSTKEAAVQGGKPSTKSSFNPTNASTSSTSRHREIKCFKCLGKGHIASQCPNKKTMILRENGEVSSASSSLSSHASSEEDSECEALCHEGDLLMVRHLLGSVAKEDDTSQRENIFHSRCLILGKVCSLIIDGGSCTNVASVRLVEKLCLTTTPHPKPYKLQWLSDEGELVVNRQVLITFSIGKYEDEVLCDVVPMEASHILLGRPWQFDKKAIHDGHSNKFTFVHRGCKITLVPMTPSQVCEDQNTMRLKKEQERKDVRKAEKKKSEFEGKLQKKREKVRTLTSEKDESEKKSEEKNQCERRENLFVREKEVRKALLASRPMYLLLCKESPHNDLIDSFANNALPSGVSSLLQEIEDVFPKEVPHGLPPIRGIEHQIDLIPGATLPNRPAYRSNPHETQEIQKQVEGLLKKGWVKESLSPCAVPVILVPKKDGNAKAEFVRKMHEKVKAQIEKKVEQQAKYANKGRKKVVFEPGDWVWAHMRKERFPLQRKLKLQPRGDGPFQVLGRISGNAYKVDLPGEYGVSATFNVSDLSLFDVGDKELNSRTNSFEEGGIDENQGRPIEDKGLKALEGLQGPMTRARAKRIKGDLEKMVAVLFESRPNLELEESKMVNCIHMEDLGSNGFY